MAEMRLIVQKIDRIEEHGNADRLAIAFTDTFNWPVIVGKDSFKPGDLVVHFPVDCCVDEKMEDILLGGSKLKLTNGRIRAAKIRGVVSYGILCPWEKIDNAYAVQKAAKDLMKDLGCHKYEPPIKVSTTKTGQKVKGRVGNPHFDKYFNMNHLQNCKGIFTESDRVVITEKLHGTSFRAGWEKREVKGVVKQIIHFFRKLINKDAEWEFVYGSRNIQLQNNKYDNSIYNQMVEKYRMKDLCPYGIIYYGEIVGEGIQRGYKYTKDPCLFIYDVKEGDKYLDFSGREGYSVCAGLEMVPVLERNIAFSDVNTDEVWKKGSVWPKEVIEGMVIETRIEEIGKFGRKKTKVINPEYLLNKENTDFH